MSREADMGEPRQRENSREADLGELRLPGSSREAGTGEPRQRENSKDIDAEGHRLLEKLVQLDSLVFPEAPWGKDSFLENAGNPFDTVLLARGKSIVDLKALLQKNPEIQNISLLDETEEQNTLLKDEPEGQRVRADAKGIPDCDREDGIKGYCILRHLDVGEILRIAVAPESRRRGIAAAMLKRTGEVALDRGCDALWLEVREGNAPARALYEKDGFAEAGRRKRYYSSPEEDAVLLKKELR